MEPAYVQVTETREGFVRLRREMAAWADRRRRCDARRRQFHTQLTSLEDTFVGALDRIEHAFGGVTTGPTTEVYPTCRLFDRRTALVRRLWTWFAEKFDQRDRDEYRKALAAADEVAWSVHVGVTRAAAAWGLPGEPAPAPLPFLDAVDAPEAVLRAEPPPALSPDSSDELLAMLLHRLPVPVVGLPVSAAWAPWTLVLLGHEVGHHLLHDLLPDGRLGRETAAAVEDAGGEDGFRWRRWSEELFADLVGLALIGPTAVHALLPLELGGSDWMLDRGRGRYPAPLVRLRTNADLVGRLGLDTEQLGLVGLDLAGLDPAVDMDRRGGDAVRRDLSRVPDVAAALLRPIGGAAGLPELVGFDAGDFLPGGIVDVRAGLLANGEIRAVEQGPRVVRELAAAAYLARVRLSGADPGAAELLAGVACEAIVDSAEEGTRSVGTAVADAVADELADLLLREPT